MMHKSCIYVGRVNHRRHEPVGHEFTYPLFMMYLDLDELPSLFDRFWLWSARRPALAWLKRSDHVGCVSKSLRDEIGDIVEYETGQRPRGPIRLLTHLRYFGYCFNPVSFYYCYDQEETLETIVAEVNNTPWGEQHCYVLPVNHARSKHGAHEFQLKKEMHVSPFMPMDIDYEWRFKAPNNDLFIYMKSRRLGDKVFDATLNLCRRPISGMNMALTLLRFPAMTISVIAGIHWQALKLWIKRVPFFVHPAKQAALEEAKNE